MKTVKEYKSLPVSEIADHISVDALYDLEERMSKKLIQICGPDATAENVDLANYQQARILAYSYMYGQLETLLTVALMELAHKESVQV